jgi:hypothetical protein
VPQNRVAPNIIDYVIDPLKISRSSINFKIKGDQKGFIYFSIADQHMPAPIFEDVRDNNKNYTLSFSNPRHLVDYIRSTSTMTVDITVYDLVPGHDY